MSKITFSILYGLNRNMNYYSKEVIVKMLTDKGVHPDCITVNEELRTVIAEIDVVDADKDGIIKFIPDEDPLDDIIDYDIDEVWVEDEQDN